MSSVTLLPGKWLSRNIGTVDISESDKALNVCSSRKEIEFMCMDADHGTQMPLTPTDCKKGTSLWKFFLVKHIIWYLEFQSTSVVGSGDIECVTQTQNLNLESAIQAKMTNQCTSFFSATGQTTFKETTSGY